MDDGSLDNSNKILKEFAKRDNRIVLYEQENKGLTKSLNYLISMADGAYIARMDADDISHPERLEKQVGYLVRNPDCGLIGTGCINIDSEGRIISGQMLPDDNKYLVSWLEKGINVYKHGSIMLRKNVVDKLSGPYRFYYGQDFDLILRMSEITGLGNVQDILYKYRLVGNSIQGMVSDIRKPQKELMMSLYFRRKEGKSEGDWKRKEEVFLSGLRKDYTREKKAHSAYASATGLFCMGHFCEARKLFYQAVKDTHLKKNAKRYILLTYLPVSLAHRVQRYVSLKNDKWSPYRLSPEELKRISDKFIDIPTLNGEN